MSQEHLLQQHCSKQSTPAETILLSSQCEEHYLHNKPPYVPGPPAEKEPPPPSRNCSTVTAVLPFTSFQPPGYSNASMACVMGEGLNCLQ